MKQKSETAVRVLIRTIFFFLYPALFSTAFTGVKLLVEQIASLQDLPWNSFVETLVVLVVFTIVFGRFFCGFACAFGTWGDLVYAISCAVRKKQRKRPLNLLEKQEEILRYGKYAVLFLTLALVAAGYGTAVSSGSPFSAFSRLHALKQPDNAAGLILFLLITAGMATTPRFFCRFLCPMGAIFSLLPVLPFSVIRRNRDNCIKGCRACRMACPAHLTIPSDAEGDNRGSGECFSCGKCIGRCPKQNVHNGLPGRLWIPALVVKAAILIALQIFLIGA